MANIDRQQINKEDFWQDIEDIFSEKLTIDATKVYTIGIEGQCRVCVTDSRPADDSADGFRLGNTIFQYTPETGNQLYIISYDTHSWINIAENASNS